MKERNKELSVRDIREQEHKRERKGRRMKNRDGRARNRRNR